MPRSSDHAGGTPVIRRAPAKVNLHLEVLARRPDGFHDLETLMVAVNLFDTLEFRPADRLSLDCTDPALPTGPDNLVLKAAAALARRTGHAAEAAIHLAKCIPQRAGLGGGSSDAAAALLGLNELWGLGLTNDKLSAVAAEVGSDVAFFLHAPAAWCTGRGEVVTPVPLGRRLHLVLVCPVDGLSTAVVFGALRVPDRPRHGTAIRSAVEAGDVAAVGHLLFNRLQGPAEALCPPIKAIYDRLAAHQPAGCLMSGSGSTLFALCDGRADAVRLAEVLREELPGDPPPRVLVVRTTVPE